MSRNEIPTAKLNRGRGGGWLVENYLPETGEVVFNAAATLQEARAVAKVVAYEQGWRGDLRWRADSKVHYFMAPVD